MSPQNSFFRSLWFLGGVIAATLIAATRVSAAVTTITGSTSDYSNPSTGTITTASITAVNLAVGGSGSSPTTSQNGILIFTLPTLTPTQAVGPLTSLTVTVISQGASTTLNGDLWGVGNFPTALPPAAGVTAPNNFNFYTNSDAGTGNANATTTDTKIADNYLSPATGIAGAVLSTPTGAGNNLQNYIQLFYTANPTYNASTGQAYVYLRINPDSTAVSTGNRYLVNSADATTAANRPVLSLDIVTVPEPSTYGLLAVGAAGLLGARRFLRRA